MSGDLISKGLTGIRGHPLTDGKIGEPIMRSICVFFSLFIPLTGSFAETKLTREQIGEVLKKASECQVLKETVVFRGSDVAKDVATAWIMNPQNLLNIQERVQSRIFLTSTYLLIFSR